jgi:hypothetical protein
MRMVREQMTCMRLAVAAAPRLDGGRMMPAPPQRRHNNNAGSCRLRVNKPAQHSMAASMLCGERKGKECQAPCPDGFVRRSQGVSPHSARVTAAGVKSPLHAAQSMLQRARVAKQTARHARMQDCATSSAPQRRGPLSPASAAPAC